MRRLDDPFTDGDLARQARVSLATATKFVDEQVASGQLERTTDGKVMRKVAAPSAVVDHRAIDEAAADWVLEDQDSDG